jgi:hypothetical protein
MTPQALPSFIWSVADLLRGDYRQCRLHRHRTHQAESVIALLQERRPALISAAVTGRIDMRKT